MINVLCYNISTITRNHHESIIKNKESKMNLKLLFDLKVNENLQENWLRFKNDLSLKYT